MDFKNVQRRVYDALNVLSAMDIIRKDKYNIIYNHYNDHIPADFGLDTESDETDSDPDREGVNQGAGNLGVQGSSSDGAAKFTLSPEIVAKREQEVFEMRKRIRDK